ncbi:uncharacterized protein TNCV_316561 [Trichonephila clavipes]|nr:uncharacterized protein TNCV_316561 [Trichonephila clavipes]
MARLLGNWSGLEVRAVIRFLWAKNESTSPMSRQRLVKLCHFSIRQTGCRKPQYDREWPVKFFSDRNHHGTIIEMIQNDRWVTLREITSGLGLSYGSVQHIIFGVLRYSKPVLRNHSP